MTNEIKSLPKNIFHSLKPQWVKDIKKMKISNSSLPESDNFEAKSNEAIYKTSSDYQPPHKLWGVVFLENLTSGINSGSAGWDYTTRILYTHTKCIRENNETIKNDKNLVTIYENMEQQLLQAAKLTNKLISIRFELFDNPDDDSKRFKNFNQILDTIEASLDENDRTLIPLCPNQNHAMLMQFEKEKDETGFTGKYSVRIFNRGSGTETWHKNFKDKCDPVYKVKNVDKKSLTRKDLNLLFLDFDKAAGTELSATEEKKDQIDAIYLWANNRGEVDDQEIHFYQKTQENGNCTYKSPNAFIRYCLPPGFHYTYFLATLNHNVRESVGNSLDASKSTLIQNSTTKEQRLFQRTEIAKKQQKFIEENKKSYPFITGSKNNQIADGKKVKKYFLTIPRGEKLLYYQEDIDQLFLLQKTALTQTIKCQRLNFSHEPQKTEPIAIKQALTGF